MRPVFREMKAMLLLLPAFAAAAATLERVATMPRIPFGFYRNSGQLPAEILYVSRGPSANISVTATSVVFGLSAHRLALKGANSAPTVSQSNPLPGMVNVYASQDSSKWARGLRLYKWIEFGNVLPNVDQRFSFADDGQLSMILTCRPGCDPQAQLQFEYRNVSSAPSSIADGSLGIKAPSATQNGQNIDVEYDKREGTSFGFRIGRFDSSAPLNITIPLYLYELSPNPTAPLVTSSGDVYMAATLPDAAGLPARFPDTAGGCYSGGGSSLRFIGPCTDAVVYRFTNGGGLVWASYFSGFYIETIKKVDLTSNALVLVGATNSSDFPATPGAYSTQYGGTPATAVDCCPKQDAFVVRIDQATGAMEASTYAGAVSFISSFEAHVGSDESVYVVSRSDSTALHLNSRLSTALYSVPLSASATDLQVDGSLLFVSESAGGISVGANAYQKSPAGKTDVVLGRLDRTGTKRECLTYIGTPADDTAKVIKADRDGGAWFVMSSGTSPATTTSVVHMNAEGSKLTATVPFSAVSIDIDSESQIHLFGTALGVQVPATDNALVRYACGAEYVRLNPEGEIRFASYLPGLGVPGYTLAGHPLVMKDTGIFQLTEKAAAQPYTGCLGGSRLAIGQFVTIFGSGLGPAEGATYQLAGNRVPTELAGTRVLFRGEAIPLLYVSHTQVNAVLPFQVPAASGPVITVQRGGQSSELILERTDLWPEHINLLTVDGKSNSQALAVNQDGTLNSVDNPAPLGSVVTFYGTGGGQTDPPSLPGEVVPLNAVRRLVRAPQVLFGDLRGGTVEWAGAAPGQISAVNQINYRLPPTLRENTNPNAAFIAFESYVVGSGATIAVK
ncbi:MAG: hypothetical protein IT168_16885 [Bryobacterales bacterium]|nr:hypothetical protein [Bryobacterales bacterium]